MAIIQTTVDLLIFVNKNPIYLMRQFHESVALERTEMIVPHVGALQSLSISLLLIKEQLALN